MISNERHVPIIMNNVANTYSTINNASECTIKTFYILKIEDPMDYRNTLDPLLDQIVVVMYWFVLFPCQLLSNTLKMFPAQ